MWQIIENLLKSIGAILAYFTTFYLLLLADSYYYYSSYDVLVKIRFTNLAIIGLGYLLNPDQLPNIKILLSLLAIGILATSHLFETLPQVALILYQYLRPKDESLELAMQVESIIRLIFFVIFLVVLVSQRKNTLSPLTLYGIVFFFNCFGGVSKERYEVPWDETAIYNYFSSNEVYFTAKYTFLSTVLTFASLS